MWRRNDRSSLLLLFNNQQVTFLLLLVGGRLVLLPLGGRRLLLCIDAAPSNISLHLLRLLYFFLSASSNFYLIMAKQLLSQIETTRNGKKTKKEWEKKWSRVKVIRREARRRNEWKRDKPLRLSCRSPGSRWFSTALEPGCSPRRCSICATLDIGFNFWQVGVLGKMAHGDMMGGAELTKPSLMFQLSYIYSSLMTYSTASSPSFQLGGSPELNSFGSGVAETLRTGRRTTGTTVSGILLTRNLAGFLASQRFQIGRHTVFYSGF